MSSAHPRKDRLRLGIIGLGNMGSLHARSILENKIPRTELAAVCGTNVSAWESNPHVKTFTRSDELIRSGAVDAVLIATPHFSHTSIGIDALSNGLHVLVEKPISVHKADCERLIAAYEQRCAAYPAPGEPLVFATVLNQRTDPFYQKIRQLVHSGDLGEIRRVNWIITNWFRTEAYYASSKWRATWRGEGGGVLLNQCLHNLDLFQWIFGMPVRVRAFASLGRYHDIEVEDDVTAYFEFPNGATGVIITSTGEAPGTNRLEISAERGRLVYENDTLHFTRNEIPTTEFSRTTALGFTAPPTWDVRIPLPASHGGQHNEILKNFADAILDGAPLIAPAQEGIHSVELANAILYSALQNQTIELPLDAAAYEAKLNELILNSRFAKKEPVSTNGPGSDFAHSFGR